MYTYMCYIKNYNCAYSVNTDNLSLKRSYVTTLQYPFSRARQVVSATIAAFLVSLGLLFLSFFASFLRETGTVDQEAIRFTKMWFFLLFALWIASSLAGAGAGVSVTLAVLTLSAFVASAILIALSFNHVEREEKVTQLWMNLIKKYDQYLNIARGLTL